jgi:hypothetical protein
MNKIKFDSPIVDRFNDVTIYNQGITKEQMYKYAEQYARKCLEIAANEAYADPEPFNCCIVQLELRKLNCTNWFCFSKLQIRAIT